MTSSKPETKWTVWGGLILILAAVAGVFGWSRLGPRSVQLPVIGQISDFKLTDQNGGTVTLADFSGKVWIADIIFTRCPGPCAKMTRHLADLQAGLPAGGRVRLVTLTSDPDYDTPAVLRRYAENFGADPKLWSFLTGDKQELRHLAVNDFKFVVVEKTPAEREIPDDLFIHSTWYVLVDQKGAVRGWMDEQGRLRAYYDSEDDSDRARLLADASQLLQEAHLQ